MRELIEELNDIKLMIFDLDGVIYRGDKLLPGVDEVIQQLKELSINIVYNSNNSTATRQMYLDKLKNFNISSKISDFYTSASITAAEISKLKKRAKIFVIGEIGLREELKACGHEIIPEESEYEKVDFVVVGLDRDFKYKNLAFAQKCILEGRAQFYATNADATLPVANGFLPGAGVMVKALETCTGINPVKIFGKPQPYGIELILKEKNVPTKNTAIFGDRMDTDILAGNLAGIITVLVLTGVSQMKEVEQLKLGGSDVNFNQIPNLILDELSKIFSN
ncbi:MAG: HAD-IIA family hydrolase [Candidatus Hermodarchaeota archaeon]